jgi:predicted glycosyltransferase
VPSSRVLIVVTHLLGAGHLTRAAALARAFARAGHKATLVSGGMPAPLVSTEGARFVQLPPVRTRGVEFGTLLDEAGAPIGPEHLAARWSALLTALAEARPDVVVTELFPFGRRVLADEFMALVGEARARQPRPLLLASVRDILAAPAKPERVAEAHRRLAELYGAVLAHGDPALLPLDASWPVDESLRPLLRYTGYVDEGGPVDAGAETERAEIVVSGGSSAAALPLLRAAAGAAARHPDRPWRLLVGGGVGEADFAELRGTAPGHASVERARPDFRALLARAALSVSQAGYNTVVDLLRAGPRALLVPFEAGRETEQRLRAESLAARGLAAVLPEAELSVEALALAVARLLGSPAPDGHEVWLDGAAETVATVAAMMGEASRGPLWTRGPRDALPR